MSDTFEPPTIMVNLGDESSYTWLVGRHGPERAANWMASFLTESVLTVLNEGVRTINFGFSQWNANSKEIDRNCMEPTSRMNGALSQKGTVPKVLFLTTEPPENIKAEWPFYQNWFLPQMIRERGAMVELRCWRDPDLDSASVSVYSSITFLWCNEYHQHPKEFPYFVRNILVHAQRLNPSLHIFNDPEIVLWNTDKHYLLELDKAGYRIPRSKFVDMCQHTHASLISNIREFSDSTPLILKPAISGSARNTHLIQDPRALTSEDLAFIDHIVAEGTNGDLILQQYEEGISSGEYSLIFVNGKHSHTILKTPHAGEYRCQGEYGGSTKEIAAIDVPPCASEAAQEIWEFLESKVNKSEKETRGGTRRELVYARVDGIIKNDTFILMEIEAIEPHLWLEAKSGSEALEQLCRVFIPNGSS